MSLFSGVMGRASAAGMSAIAGNAELVVLVVHPEALVRDTLSVALGMCAPRIGRVLEAGSLDAALTQMREQQVDLVFCSLLMPEASGAEVLRRLGPALGGAELALISRHTTAVEPAVEEALHQRLQLRGILAEPVSCAEVKRVMERGFSGQPRRPSPMAVQGISPRELEDALDECQIEVHYQPTVSIGSRRLIGVEALARWNHPWRGRLDAGQFVLLAERSGLMPSLTLTVARQALKQVGSWRSDGLPVSLTLNISTAGLDDMDLPELLLRSAESAGVSPQWVVLELSERHLSNAAGIYGTLSKLRHYGFRLAVDNFGAAEDTGISILRRLHFTELKIDRSLVTDAASSSRKATLADTVELGRRLDMRVTACGVETRDDWTLLARIGCSAAQGHWICPPAAADTLPAWKEKWSKRENGDGARSAAS